MDYGVTKDAGVTRDDLDLAAAREFVAGIRRDLHMGKAISPARASKMAEMLWLALKLECPDCHGEKTLQVDGVTVDCPCQDAEWRALCRPLRELELYSDEEVNDMLKKAAEA